MRSKGETRKCNSHEARRGPVTAARPRRPRLLAAPGRGRVGDGRSAHHRPIAQAVPARTVPAGPTQEESPLSTRVHEVAKELGLKSQELLDRIQRWGLDVKVSALASLDPAMVGRIKELMTGPAAPATPASPAPPAAPPRPAPSETSAISAKAPAAPPPSRGTAPSPAAPAADRPSGPPPAPPAAAPMAAPPAAAPMAAPPRAAAAMSPTPAAARARDPPARRRPPCGRPAVVAPGGERPALGPHAPPRRRRRRDRAARRCGPTTGPTRAPRRP